MFDDRCICCGDIIPEGRQICPMCENDEINSLENRYLHSAKKDEVKAINKKESKI